MAFNQLQPYKKRFYTAKCESDKVEDLLALIEKLLNGIPDYYEIVTTSQVTEMRQLSTRITAGNQVQLWYVQYFIFENKEFCVE